MKKILALTTIGNTAPLKEAVEKIKREYGEILEVTKIYLHDYELPDVSIEPVRRKVEEADIILVDIRGDMRISREFPNLLMGRENKTVVVLVAGSQQIWAYTRMGRFKGEMIFKPGKEKEFNINTYLKTKRFSSLTKILGSLFPFGVLKDMKNWIVSQQYYLQGDSENLKNLLLFLLKNYGGVKNIGDVPPPREMLPYGLYAPKYGILVDINHYREVMGFKRENPIVGVLLYGGMHFEDTRPIADALYFKFKDDLNFIFVFSNVENNLKAVERYFEGIDLFLNCQYFRLHGGPYGGDPEPTYELLKKIDVPVLIGLRTYDIDIGRWEESKEGLDPLHIVLGITLPELDGCIEPIMMAVLRTDEDPILGKVRSVITLDDRVEKIGSRMKNWINLRRKTPSEKRIAIITYNYPPGEENLGSAGYLDVFESLKRFLVVLKERGYSVEIPQGSLKDIFLSEGVVNTPNYVNRTCLKVPLIKYNEWFKSLPDTVQTDVIRCWGPPPGDVMVGGDNILIPCLILGNVLLGVQPSRGVHGDSDKVYHDRDLPPHHQYLAYYMFLQKEFKCDAIIHFGMHGTLEFTKGKEVGLSSRCFPDILIGDIPHIYYYWIGNTSESTIAKRRSYAVCISHSSPPVKSSGLYEKYIVLEDLLNQYESDRDDKILELIREISHELHLMSEISELRSELYRMKRRLIPYGLHIIDRIPQGEEVVEYLFGVLRIDREFPSILKLVSGHLGYNWEDIKDSKIGDEVERQAKSIIRDIVSNKIPDYLPEGYVKYVRDILKNLNDCSESEGLLRALEGRYVLPARGGDPIRDPEVYPSGRAMCGFDPRLIPTVLAEMRGKKSADLLIESYLKKYGRYPESVGIVLWGFETMKTGGDTISTIFSLLGVRIIHKKSLWFKEIEVIPLEELKRPRIDVVITICGIFRETFKDHIDLINRAIDMVANLDEPIEKNYVRKHFLNLRDKLMDFALARIFGPAPLEYATSVRTLIENSMWKDEKDIVRNYDDSMSYAYFRGRIERAEEAFTDVLRSIDLVTQERDNVEYEITDLDHYYEFLGGLSRSVQEKKGVKTDTMVVDSTEEEVIVEDLKVAIERATRTRLLNPVWIEGMLKHDFHGAKKIKDRVEYLLAFSATTGQVENWIFDSVADRLIFDEKTRRELQKNNPYATIKIGEILIESAKRGYWKVDQERLDEIRKMILDIEGYIE